MIFIYTEIDSCDGFAIEWAPDENTAADLVEHFPESIFFFAELTMEEEYHDEDTIMRVGEAIRTACIVDLNQIRDVILAMQNHGILFRERRPNG